MAKKSSSVESIETAPHILKYEEVVAARRAICTSNGIQLTPCVRAKMSENIGADVYLKLENFNYTGNFKDRGARYCLLNFTSEEKEKGVVAVSMGNHAQGMAYNGRDLGIPVTVVMPKNAALMKINKCKKLGAKVVIEGNDIYEAKLAAKRIARKTGAIFAWDTPKLVAGQGTIGLEVIDQIGRPDAIICPAGSGGVLAGVATVMKEISPSTVVIGVESELCPAFTKAFEIGKPVKTDCTTSIADGLAITKVGPTSIASCLGRVDKVITVSEALINVAILYLLEFEKQVIEGAGAAPLAGLLSGQLSHLKGKKIVLVCTGGNIDTVMLGRVLERALVAIGKLIKCSVLILDKPAAQAELLEYVAELGGNVKQIHTERAWVQSDDYSMKVNMLIEVTDIEHALEFTKSFGEKYPKHEFPDFPRPCVAQRWANLII